MPVCPLSLSEREEIRVGVAAGETITAIARCLGRHRTTISREVTRNGGRDRYQATAAQARAERCRARPKVPKLVSDRALAAHVGRRLRAKDSPMTISIELARGTRGVTARISHEAIYRAVYAHGNAGLSAGLHRHLALKHRARKHRNRRQVRSHSLGIFCRITDRPAVADERREVGHLEGDQIVGRLNQTAILTVFDRASRYLWLGRLDHGKGAAATTTALIRLLKRIPAPLRRTLTWDQGAEMARHREIALACGIDIYFADAKSPWQRPTNENGNALVRRHVGNSTDLSTFTTRQLRAIEHRINTIPRHTLNWSTAEQIYNQSVATTG